MRGTLPWVVFGAGFISLLLALSCIEPPALDLNEERTVQRRRAAVSRWQLRWRPRAQPGAQAAALEPKVAMAELPRVAQPVDRPQARAVQPDEIPQQTKAAAANPPPDCSHLKEGRRRPYHTVLTASSGAYQRWQTRIFYYHYIRLRSEQGPCSEMGGFTRLLTQPRSAPPDELMGVMRTVVVHELTESETHGFVVLNRPHSVLTALNRGDFAFNESYLFIAETDHLLMKPLPNLASENVAVAYPFHYMNPRRDPKTIALVRRFAGSDSVAANVQQVGPSPVLIHQAALRRLVQPWYDLSFALKVDPAADAEFGWMLEMWGYSIGAAVGGVRHELLESFQLEPSSQFGTRTTDAAGQYTHHILHYTFSHEYSLEGVPMIDSRAGAYSFDKRNYQSWLPYQLQQPPRCALEATQTLWGLLHDAMVAHDRADCRGCTGEGRPWEQGVGTDKIRRLMEHANHDKHVRSRTDEARGDGPAERARARALLVVGSGPWTFRDAVSGAVEGPFFFLRGGQLHTPWGSAAWTLASAQHDAGETHDPIVIYLCGREKWTHSVALQTAAGAPLAEEHGLGSSGSGWAWLRDVRLVMTSRASKDVQHGSMDVAAAEAAVAAAAAAGAAEGTPTSAAELRAAFLAPGEGDGVRRSASAETAREVRQRLVGTGPWPLGHAGEVLLLAHGTLYSMRTKRFGSWRADTQGAGGGGAIVLRGGGVGGGTLSALIGSVTDSVTADELRLSVDCWRLSSSSSPHVVSDLVWRHPASRCFPTCSDSTHQLTVAEFHSSELAQRASKHQWSWAGIPGLAFKLEGAGVLVTPWGHGEWGVTPSRTDVLVADFAQQKHMLRFDAGTTSFVSTRCSDGEIVQGRRTA